MKQTAILAGILVGAGLWWLLSQKSAIKIVQASPVVKLPPNLTAEPTVPSSAEPPVPPGAEPTVTAPLEPTVYLTPDGIGGISLQMKFDLPYTCHSRITIGNYLNRVLVTGPIDGGMGIIAMSGYTLLSTTVWNQLAIAYGLNGILPEGLTTIESRLFVPGFPQQLSTVPGWPPGAPKNPYPPYGTEAYLWIRFQCGLWSNWSSRNPKTIYFYGKYLAFKGVVSPDWSKWQRVAWEPYIEPEGPPI